MSRPELTVKYVNGASEFPVSVFGYEGGNCIASSGVLGKAGYNIVKPILNLPGAVHYKVTDEWLIAGYVKDEENGLLYVLGPALISGFDRFSPQKYLQAMGFPAQSMAQYGHYLESLPETKELKFSKQLMLLHYIVFGTEPENENLGNVVMTNRQQLHLRSISADTPERVPQNYELEMQMLQYVEKGDLVGMKSFLKRKISSGGEMRKTSDDFLRSAKNTLINAVALVSRAAVRSGVDYAYATKIADNYVFQAERLNSARDVFALNSDMLLKFTELTHAYNALGVKSKLVHDVFNYINANAYQKICLNDIAEALGLSVSYVSRKFKEDTGVALNKYITQYKLEKGKALLLSTDMSISSIAYSLGFSSQNYFHKVFKDSYGKTPVEYKATVNYGDD